MKRLIKGQLVIWVYKENILEIFLIILKIHT